MSARGHGGGQRAGDAERTSREYFKGADALISVTFDGEEEDEISLAALSAIRELLEPYDYYIDSAVGNSQAASLANEMGIILAVAAGDHRAGAAAHLPLLRGDPGAVCSPLWRRRC